jgi:RNA polymerase sigma-70 factor (ECF subfamily)
VRFETVYEMYYPAVLAYVRRRTDSAEDAADAIAETFLTAWRRFDDLPPGDEARLWLYGVARRVLANQRRGQARRTALTERLRSELAAQDVRGAEPAEPALVGEAFARLSDDDRELLSLVGWEGLTPAEAAVVLGCSRGAVRIRLHRARKRLARELSAIGLDLSRFGLRAALLVEGKS